MKSSSKCNFKDCIDEVVYISSKYKTISVYSKVKSQNIQEVYYYFYCFFIINNILFLISNFYSFYYLQFIFCKEKNRDEK